MLNSKSYRYFGVILLISLFSAIFSLQSPISAQADETFTHPATDYAIDGVIEVTKGPYKPGDLIAFDVKTALPRAKFHYFQVTGECMTAPAEWHVGTENKFLDNQYVRKGYATTVISSGCHDGSHQILEVEIEDQDHGYARINFDGTNVIGAYVTSQGQLRMNADNSIRLKDSINIVSLPREIRMKSNKPFKIWGLSRLTSHNQTISWAVNGRCLLRRGQGAGDNGGDLLATAPGKCFVAANTPWGSNLFDPVNQAWEIRVFSSKALLCVNTKTKKQLFTEKNKCPKGYSKK